jgi:hypothetical protein
MDFTESELKKKTVDQLKGIAKRRGIDLTNAALKDDIITAILKDQKKTASKGTSTPKIVEAPNPLVKVNAKVAASKVTLKVDKRIEETLKQEEPKKRHAYWV